MKSKEQKSRSAIEAGVRAVYAEILKMPSYEMWRAKAHPVERQNFESNLRKVFEGAGELLWIGANDYIWMPYGDENIHHQKGEASKRIRDFISIYPSIEILHNPHRHIVLLEEAANVAAAINLDDSNDRVWEYYRGAITQGAATPSKRMEPDWPGLYDVLDKNKTNPSKWSEFVELLKEYREGEAINMARIAWILHAGRYTEGKISWCEWYKSFCSRCGLEPNATYAKDAKKINPYGKSTQAICLKIGGTGFLREKKGGEPLNHHHIPIDDRRDM